MKFLNKSIYESSPLGRGTAQRTEFACAVRASNLQFDSRYFLVFQCEAEVIVSQLKLWSLFRAIRRADLDCNLEFVVPVRSIRTFYTFKVRMLTKFLRVKLSAVSEFRKTCFLYQTFPLATYSSFARLVTGCHVG